MDFSKSFGAVNIEALQELFFVKNRCNPQVIQAEEEKHRYGEGEYNAAFVVRHNIRG